MIAFVRTHATQLALGGTLVLAGVSGAFVASALSAGTQPAVTTTITLANGATGPTGAQGLQGERGPQGATGPQGAGGAETCPTGSTFGKLVIDHPHGHVSILTCIVEQ